MRQPTLRRRILRMIWVCLGLYGVLLCLMCGSLLFVVLGGLG